MKPQWDWRTPEEGLVRATLEPIRWGTRTKTRASSSPCPPRQTSPPPRSCPATGPFEPARYNFTGTLSNGFEERRAHSERHRRGVLGLQRVSLAGGLEKRISSLCTESFQSDGSHSSDTRSGTDSWPHPKTIVFLELFRFMAHFQRITHACIYYKLDTISCHTPQQLCSPQTRLSLFIS